MYANLDFACFGHNMRVHFLVNAATWAHLANRKECSVVLIYRRPECLSIFLICSRPFILANIKTKNSSSNIQSDAISGANVCLKHTERHKCFAHKATEDTNWADINRGLRVHWCRNLGTTDFISHIIWHFVSSYSFTAATATTATKTTTTKMKTTKKSFGLFILWKALKRHCVYHAFK